MNKVGSLTNLLVVLIASFGAAPCFAQGGAGGGFGGGGLQGGQGGRMSERYDGSIQWIERTLATYLDGEPVKSLMTPGEFTEWKLTLKQGQVVIAEAWSEAFDPALEIVDKDKKVLFQNDDRFPGDQRPLLFWRCPSDGEYSLYARCYADKFGGQFFVRMKTYKSFDAVENGSIDVSVGSDTTFLVRMPLKTGEIRRIMDDRPNDGNFTVAYMQTAISPLGLPDVRLTEQQNPILGNAVMASVAGDYYVLASAGSRDRNVRIKSVTQKLVEMGPASQAQTSHGKKNDSSLWSLKVKKGEVIEVHAPSLSLSSVFVLSERPDISKFDLADDAKNPFFPRVPTEAEANQSPIISELPGRARDSRYRVFYVHRDGEVWLGCNGSAAGEGEYEVNVKPCLRPLGAGASATGGLKIGYTDYWAYDASAGDVMTFHTSASGFAQSVRLYDPNMTIVYDSSTPPDVDSMDWNTIVTTPGKYLVAVSAIGDGASGSYSIERNVFSARSFSRGNAAVGDFSTGKAEVWKFTAKPDEPLLVRWTTGKGSYSISVRDENGRNMPLPLTTVANNERYGILKVDRELTYVIVLISDGSASNYRIELSSLPGFGSKGD